MKKAKRKKKFKVGLFICNDKPSYIFYRKGKVIYYTKKLWEFTLLTKIFRFFGIRTVFD